MNYKIYVRLSSVLLVGAAFFLTGCGPENLDDPSYIAQMNDGGLINNAKDMASTKEETMPADNMNDKAKDQDRQGRAPLAGQAGQPGFAAGQPGAIAQGGVAPVASVAVAATPVAVAELPPAFVAEPSEYVENPLIETTTGEHHAFNQTIVHEQQTIVNQPHLNTHVITSSLNTHHQLHKTVINTDTFANQVVGSPTAFTETVEVLPTTVIEAPPAVVAPVPVVPVAVVPGCAPFLGGGFYRGCGLY